MLRKRWLQSSIVNINEAKAKELARVDHLEREYWEAWERSIGEHRTKTVKARGTAESADVAEQTLKTEDINGDPRYLSGVQWCINKRCEVLGLDAPASTRNLNLDVTSLSDEQLERIGNGEDPIHVLATSGAGGDRTSQAQEK